TTSNNTAMNAGLPNRVTRAGEFPVSVDAVAMGISSVSCQNGEGRMLRAAARGDIGFQDVYVNPTVLGLNFSFSSPSGLCIACRRNDEPIGFEACGSQSIGNGSRSPERKIPSILVGRVGRQW